MLAGLLSAVVAVAIARRVALNSPEAPKSISSPRLGSAVVTVAGVAGLQVVMAQTDIAMLGMLASAEEVGVYRVAAQFAALGAVVIMAVNAVIGPELARLGHEGDRVGLERIARLGSRFGTLGTIGVIIALAGLGRWALVVSFGADFVGAWSPMMILVVGHMVTVVLGSTVTVAHMMGLERELFRITAAMMVPNVALNVFLIPRFGAVGAASATLISVVVWRSLLYLWVRRRIRVNTSLFGGALQASVHGAGASAWRTHQ